MALLVQGKGYVDLYYTLVILVFSQSPRKILITRNFLFIIIEMILYLHAYKMRV